jgi:Outer membrane protein beta-barrel domain
MLPESWKNNVSPNLRPVCKRLAWYSSHISNNTMKKRFTILFFALLITGWASAQRMALSAGVQYYLVPEAYSNLYLDQNLAVGGNIGLNYRMNHNNALQVMFGAATNRLFQNNSASNKIDILRSDMVYRRYRRFNESFSMYGQVGTSLMQMQLEGLAISSISICDCTFEFPIITPPPTVVTERHYLAGGLAGLGVAVDLSQRISLQADINASYFLRQNEVPYLTAVPNFSILYGL